LFPDTAEEVLPYLATLLNLPVPQTLEDRIRNVGGEAMGRLVYRTSRRLFTRLAEERPTVVVVEDVHWLDASSAALLEHLLPLSIDLSLLFIFVARPEPDTPLARVRELGRGEYVDRYTEIVLRPLSKAESAELVHNLIHLDDLPVRLQETILAKAEGNPFFVEEVVRSLIDLGGLRQEPGTGRWAVSEQAAHIAIPDTLQGVIMARVDRLDEDLKQVLRLASVIGRSFLHRVLASIAEADRELDQNLAALEAREFVRERARDPELEYIFKHALVHEATYESILLQRRKELHRRVGAAIEELFADRLDEFYSLLAYHYSQAEDWERAREYLLKAGDQAGSIAADAEALDHYEKAIDAHAKVFGDRWDPFDRAVLEHKIGEALFRRGERVKAREHLERAFTLLGFPLPAGRRPTRWAIVRSASRQLGHRFLPETVWRTWGNSTREVAQERCDLLHVMAIMDLFSAPDRLLFMLMENLNVAEEAGLEPETAGGLAAVGYGFDTIPLRRAAWFYQSRAIALADRQPHPHAVAWGYTPPAVHAHGTGDWRAAHEYYERSIEGFVELGDLHMRALQMTMRADLLCREGDFTGGLDLAREILETGESTGDRNVVGWGLSCRGRVLSQVGAPFDGESDLRKATELLLEVQDLTNLARNLAWLGACLLHQGNLDEAVEAHSSSERLIRDHGLRCTFGTDTWNGLAAAKLALAEETEGGERTMALREAREHCRAAIRQGRLDYGGMVAAHRCTGTYHLLVGHRRRAVRSWHKSLAVADQLGARYEGAVTRLEIGRRLGDRAGLEAAETEFAAMGASWWRGEARRELGWEPTASSTESLIVLEEGRADLEAAPSQSLMGGVRS
jgi:tetratricopeptide (TPR) repeat protein